MQLSKVQIWGATALFFLGLLALSTTGCKRAVGADGKLFQTAKPEIKAAWDGAMAAAKTNGYAQAILTLQALRQQPGLTAEQAQAIDKTATAVNDQLHDAANKDDPNALKSIEVLRKARSR